MPPPPPPLPTSSAGPGPRLPHPTPHLRRSGAARVVVLLTQQQRQAAGRALADGPRLRSPRGTDDGTGVALWNVTDRVTLSLLV